MNVLVVGGGGREHALTWKIAQSELVENLYCAPGNAGIASVQTRSGKCAECVNIEPTDLPALVDFAKDKQIDLTVVGPEIPLVAGIVDVFEKEGLQIFGPSQKAAELEGSKVFAKNIMRKHAIPTAEFNVFDDPDHARQYIDAREAPIVVKADGLAAGKGVIICHTREEAHNALNAIMEDKQFGDAGNLVIVEDCLKGEEASILAFTDGRTIMTMESSQDHKAIFDGDEGPNTGGMGAYSPAPIITDSMISRIEKEVLVPIVHAMNCERRAYRGVLYAGIMLTPSGPKTLEFNCRFGDPETQPILMRLKSDLVPVLMATAKGELDTVSLEWDPRPTVCVVMASGGYPGSYEKGKTITGLDGAAALDDVAVFHAGTAEEDGKVVTAGGRVLGVTAIASAESGDQRKNIASAKARAYEAVSKISFEGAQYRNDIADKALK